MKVFVTKDQFGLKYRTEINNSSWKSFPTTVKTANDIKNYFEQGRHQPAAGRYDTPRLDFRDEKFLPVVFFTVTKDKRFAVANFDETKRVNIDVKDLATELEIHDFLRPRCAFDLEPEVLNLDTLAEKNALLISKASSQALSELDNTIKTNDAINLYLTNHAKQFHNTRTVINFEE